MGNEIIVIEKKEIRADFKEKYGLHLRWLADNSDGRQGNFKNMKLLGVNIFKNCDFRKASFHGTSFGLCDLRGSDFSEASCYDTSFYAANLEGVNFIGANLRNADFTDANMKGIITGPLGEINISWADSEGRVIRQWVKRVNGDVELIWEKK